MNCTKAVYKPVWHVPLLSVQWINSCWWTDELSETCRFSCQNKFEKLVRLVGFIIKKFVTKHGHMNVKSIIRHYKNTVEVAYHNGKSHVTGCWHTTPNTSRHRAVVLSKIIWYVNCQYILKHKMICILALTNLKTATWTAETCRWLQCNKIIFIHPTAFAGLCKLFIVPINTRNI
jgi:hypothetical protein